ncbi:MAG: SMP-30/gluconolactonase/LRE family protein [Bryobacteraceae bacterium]|nr:SMP-30/gluconolactonase/LRE family protein [Bryobacteraceae bacterium]
MNYATVIFIAGVALGAETYVLGPDSQPQAGVPQGKVTKHVLPPGKYYPGTPHNYSLYVPAQYDAAKPMPLMIFLDGSGSLSNTVRVPVVLDNLIAKGDLPPMIGIFVDPGVLPPAQVGTQSRFERVFEYDSLSDRYSRFLLEELLPEVGRAYNLTTDPNQRGISGVSTGAVGAFAAAWNRPDQFRRVLSFIGTFVAMKGADGLPALIRRTEPKPIRLFLQAGRNDHIVPAQPYGTFYGGSWPINNQLMIEALEFAGYDAKLVLGDEGHNMKHGAALMPEALRWLWRGYPEPITVREPAGKSREGWDPRGKVYATVAADQPWEAVGAEYGRITSVTANREGGVYFADDKGVYRTDAAGRAETFQAVTGVKGLSTGADGRLYASVPSRKQIVSWGPKGDRQFVTASVTAESIAVTAKGTVYFIDATSKSIGLVDAAGRQRLVKAGGDIAQPSAITLSPDQGMLQVADGQSRFSWSFQIGLDGALNHGEPFYRLEMPESGWMSGVSSVTEDTLGQVYFASPLGVQICEANGRVAMILNPPTYGPVTGVTFAGPKLNWLYVTQEGKLFRRPTKVRGAAAWDVQALPKPPL